MDVTSPKIMIRLTLLDGSGSLEAAPMTVSMLDAADLPEAVAAAAAERARALVERRVLGGPEPAAPDDPDAEVD